jgi:hypothetical protein
MILELADIRIHPGQQAAFDEAIQRGLTTVANRAKALEFFIDPAARDEPPREAVQYRSDWIALTADAAFARTLATAGGELLEPLTSDRRVWTDDHHNLFEVLK